jgi:choline dehydrogenase-like flavoprotein
MESDYDVIIIGAGVAGALAAYSLMCEGAKLKVLMLEAGQAEPDRLKLVGNYASADRKSSVSPYKGSPADTEAPFPDPDKLTDYYVQSSDRNFQFQSTYLRLIGGSTWHWLGNVPRFVPSDFRMRSQYGVGVDWPISYDDLERWYGKAEHELGVSGDHAEWDGLHGARRSHDFPMSKIWLSYSDLVAARDIDGLEVDGLRLKVMSTPQARNSQPYQGRPPCAGNSICVPICPIKAKYDATVHVELARRAGVELRDKAVVVRLELDDEGRYVRRVVYRRWDDHEEVAVTGRLVVLAAHAVETPKLLLLSASDRAPKGVANASDQVGRNLMDHLQGSSQARANEPLFPFRGPPTTAGIDVFRDGQFRRERAAFRMSLGNDGWARSGSPWSDVIDAVKKEKRFGDDLIKQLQYRVTHQFRISYSTEMLPDSENRIELDTQLDASGIRRPKITFKGAPEYNQLAFAKAWAVMHRIYDAMGIPKENRTVTEDTPENRKRYSGAGHIMGTCRMGDNPKTSVVDRDCRSHDHPNLFIVGSSTFPTGGTANPTLTVAALALRAADTIKRQLAQA